MSDILVRHSEPTDARAVWSIFQQPRAIRGTLQLPYTSLEKWSRRLSETRDGFFSLVAEVGGDVVAHLGLEVHQQWRRRHAAGLGMVVHDNFQGRGVGSALMTSAVELADGWLGLTRLELEVYPDNEPAIALYRKFDFEDEGLMRNAVFRQGELVDVLLMARLQGIAARS